MSRNNSIKIFTSLLVLIAVACSCFNIPGVITPSGTVDQPAPPPPAGDCGLCNYRRNYKEADILG